MRTRREFMSSTVQVGAGLALLPYASEIADAQDAGVLVNDIHSQLNETRVAGVIAVDSEEALGRAITAARREGKAVSIAGGRHAMGGQQFATGSMLIDTRSQPAEGPRPAMGHLSEADRRRSALARRRARSQHPWPRPQA